MGGGGQALGPQGDEPCKLVRLLIIAAQGAVGAQTSRPEKYDGVVYRGLAKALQGAQIFGENPHRPAVLAVEKVRILVGKHR